MSSNKQILVIIMSILICVSEGFLLRKKREGPEAVASFFIDKAAEAMAIMEHGAAYQGDQNHHFDVFGAQAGVDAKPKVGFGDAVREDTDDRRKRQAESEYMNEMQNPEDKDAGEIHSIFQEMWQTMVEGGKKIIKKVADMIDRDGSQQPQGEPEQERTY